MGRSATAKEEEEEEEEEEEYHVIRMDDTRTPKRILEWKPIGTRIRGRPRKRWIADIEEDMQIMGVRRWRKQCEERVEWKKITGKAKT